VLAQKNRSIASITLLLLLFFFHICQQRTMKLTKLNYPVDTAEYAKLPIIAPFLQPSAEFINGVNFASGGAGILPETNQGQVGNLHKSFSFLPLFDL
jgi:hypothetical protein